MTDQEPGEPIRLRPTHERDAAMREHIETTRYVDPVTGEEYDPPEPRLLTTPRAIGTATSAPTPTSRNDVPCAGHAPCWFEPTPRGASYALPQC
jgi:hypothetical protein